MIRAYSIEKFQASGKPPRKIELDVNDFMKHGTEDLFQKVHEVDDIYWPPGLVGKEKVFNFKQTLAKKIKLKVYPNDIGDGEMLAIANFKLYC